MLLAEATNSAANNEEDAAACAVNPKIIIKRGVLITPPPIPSIDDRVPTPTAKRTIMESRTMKSINIRSCKVKHGRFPFFLLKPYYELLELVLFE